MLRWANRFLSLIPTAKEKVIKFVSGQGNFLAATRLSGLSQNIYENQDLSSQDLAGASGTNTINPILKPEIITFEYPMTRAEWKALKANPDGIVRVDGEDTWIKDVTYNFQKYTAKFDVIPKY